MINVQKTEHTTRKKENFIEMVPEKQKRKKEEKKKRKTKKREAHSLFVVYCDEEQQ